MGALIAIAIIWWACKRATPPEKLQKQKRNNAIAFGAAAWMLFDGIFNSDKRNRYD